MLSEQHTYEEFLHGVYIHFASMLEDLKQMTKHMENKKALKLCSDFEMELSKMCDWMADEAYWIISRSINATYNEDESNEERNKLVNKMRMHLITDLKYKVNTITTLIRHRPNPRYEHAWIKWVMGIASALVIAALSFMGGIIWQKYYGEQSHKNTQLDSPLVSKKIPKILVTQPEKNQPVPLVFPTSSPEPALSPESNPFPAYDGRE